MHEQNNPTILVKVPAVNFESNKDFQSKSLMHEDDSGFLRFYQRRMKPVGDSQANREILTTLLSTQGDNTRNNVEKLLAENVSYRDLASLTHQDLELIGFTQPKQRNELLKFFALLPNQDPSLEQIYCSKAASSYNHQIINNASNHLISMQSALAAANYKLQIMPPGDVIVGEKSFASRFVLEALDELYGVTEDIESQILEVENIIYKKRQKTEKSQSSTTNNFHLTAHLVLGSLSSIGALLTLYFWKYNK